MGCRNHRAAVRVSRCRGLSVSRIRFVRGCRAISAVIPDLCSRVESGESLPYFGSEVPSCRGRRRPDESATPKRTHDGLKKRGVPPDAIAELSAPEAHQPVRAPPRASVRADHDRAGAGCGFADHDGRGDSSGASFVSRFHEAWRSKSRERTWSATSSGIRLRHASASSRPSATSSATWSPQNSFVSIR